MSSGFTAGSHQKINANAPFLILELLKLVEKSANTEKG